MLNIFKKLNALHEAYEVPSVARLANRLVFNKYKDINMGFIFIVFVDRTTLLLPLNKETEVSSIPKQSRATYVMRIKLTHVSVSNITNVYAVKLLKEAHDLDDSTGRDLSLTNLVSIST